jgi:hypothetical protein
MFHVLHVACDLRCAAGELGVVSTLSVPQKGQEGQRNVWCVASRKHNPTRNCHRDVPLAGRFVCSLDDRDGRLGVWAGAKVRSMRATFFFWRDISSPISGWANSCKRRRSMSLHLPAPQHTTTVSWPQLAFNHPVLSRAFGPCFLYQPAVYSY